MPKLPIKGRIRGLVGRLIGPQLINNECPDLLFDIFAVGNKFIQNFTCLKQSIRQKDW